MNGWGWVIVAASLVTAALVWFDGSRNTRSLRRERDAERDRCRKLNSEMAELSSQAPCGDRGGCIRLAHRLEQAEAKYAELATTALDLADAAIEIREGTNHHFRGTWNCEQRFDPTDGLAS